MNPPSRPPDLSTKLPKLVPRKRGIPLSNPLPVPETPPLSEPPSASSITFSKPVRRIISPYDHQVFLVSDTFALLLSFVFTLSDDVKATPCSAVRNADMPLPLQTMLKILNEVEETIDEAPPEEQGDSRFGNKGFRTFLEAVGAKAAKWHELLGIKTLPAIEEVSTYFLESFGNSTRIDYGSGHELNFIVWLLCLYQLSIIQRSAFPALALRVFPAYLKLMRRIQKEYYLEPAGSHGVWGLDDYQFLPFLFGASQLVDHPYIRPLAIHNTLTIEESSADFLYLAQVKFTNESKNVDGLRWHSPMLDDISSAKSWVKVRDGMKRMFVKEILKKVPVMQHFLFGGLIPASEKMSKALTILEDSEDPSFVVVDGMRHVHSPNSWGDCCGIKVPGSIGAAQEVKKRSGAEEFRRIPFD
ncbi:MAG: Serine/threonine-protein phosphatase 2A activator 2 [Vezdaea aestivalis]|nr:MAG: Serine/threonine-protein phosphatase 2A activator 2 [Vezdaea aestivalis]